MSAPAVELEDWLAPLVPRFLENRAHEARALAAALAAGDFAQLRFIGHKMRGAAAGFGFAAIADIGLRLEDAAAAADAPAAAVCIEELERYLGTVTVVFRPSGQR